MSGTLQLDHLDAGYREVIVSDVNFTVSAGEIFVIVGVNGAGKSTILKAIMGQARVHGGRVLHDDHDVTSRATDYVTRHGVGYVPQLNDVFPGLSVMSNLKMGGYTLPRSALAERIERSFVRFPQLAHKRRVAAQNLSGGERKQLALARALMVDPQVLLLDEPTSNLAPQIVDYLLHEQLPELARENRCLVIVEQRVEAALEIADRACLIGGGHVVQIGDAEAMLKVLRTDGLLVSNRTSSDER
jgi:branched-chain amino acid transport system ATP-binding protein